MEDASIYEVELGDGNSLFAVFDGHGGLFVIIQDMKLASSLRPNSLINCFNSAHINQETIVLPFKMPLD